MSFQTKEDIINLLIYHLEQPSINLNSVSFELVADLFVKTYENLNKNDIPMLALWGKKDGVVPFSGSKEYQRIFIKGKLVVLEEGTHDITYRQPTIVGKEIIDFINQL